MKKPEADIYLTAYFSRSVFLSGAVRSGGCFSFHASSRDMIWSFITRGVAPLTKYLFSSAFTPDVYGHVTAQIRQESTSRMEQYIQSVSAG